MTTVFITGASGFFGRSLVEALKKTENDYQFICTYHTKKYEINDERFSWIEADLLDHSSHSKLIHMTQPTDLIHLAWDVPPGNFWHSLKNVDWLYASISLFNEFCARGGKKFVGAGSSTEYDWTAAVLDEETTSLNPSTLYGECKKASHAIIKKIQQRDYRETVLIWARIGYFFGPQEPPQKLVSRIIDSIINQSSLNLVEANTSRPYAHVRYVGEVLSHVLFHQDQSIDFNLSGSHQYPLKEIVEFIGKQLKKSTHLVHYGAYKSPIAEPLQLIINTDRLAHKIGYKIPDTFYEDLENMIKGKLG